MCLVVERVGTLGAGGSLKGRDICFWRRGEGVKRGFVFLSFFSFGKREKFGKGLLCGSIEHVKHQEAREDGENGSREGGEGKQRDGRTFFPHQPMQARSAGVSQHQ